MNDERTATMRRHPAGKAVKMPNDDNNVIPFRPKTEATPPPQPDIRSKASQTLALLDAHGEQGMTVGELSAHMGWHHGTASSTLSTLHRRSEIARLVQDRNGQAVYVIPRAVNERPTVRPTVNQQGLVHGMAASLRKFYRPCSHDPQYPHETCRQCEVRVLLQRYDKLRGSSN